MTQKQMLIEANRTNQFIKILSSAEMIKLGPFCDFWMLTCFEDGVREVRLSWKSWSVWEEADLLEALTEAKVGGASEDGCKDPNKDNSHEAHLNHPPCGWELHCSVSLVEGVHPTIKIDKCSHVFQKDQGIGLKPLNFRLEGDLVLLSLDDGHNCHVEDHDDWNVCQD